MVYLGCTSCFCFQLLAAAFGPEDPGEVHRWQDWCLRGAKVLSSDRKAQWPHWSERLGNAAGILQAVVCLIAQGWYSCKLRAWFTDQLFPISAYWCENTWSSLRDSVTTLSPGFTWIIKKCWVANAALGRVQTYIFSYQIAKLFRMYSGGGARTQCGIRTPIFLWFKHSALSLQWNVTAVWNLIFCKYT